MLGDLTTTLTLDDAEELGILNQVREEHEKVGLLFSELVKGNKEQRRNRDEIISFLELEEKVRFEHHVVESWKSIVIQPYDRLEEMVELAGEVKNLAAKHEGGIPDVEKTLDHPSDILDYFLTAVVGDVSLHAATTKRAV